jgi:DNA polymerase III delta prime subunit
MDLDQYIQQICKIIYANRLPHAIIVEAKNNSDILCYLENCAKIILKTDQLETHPDFFSIAPTGKINAIKIEAIRELIEYAQKTPHSANKKVIIIFEAHKLNRNAAEALLKTLEEPPLDTVLWLTTPSKYLLLPTIISRCALHHLPEDFKQNLPQTFTAWLGQVELFLQKLSVNIEDASILEVYSLLDILSKNIENFENNEQDGDKKNISIKDIYSPLLRAITEKIWHISHGKIPPHSLEHRIEIVSKSSLILTVNGSFLHVIENILLQLYQMNICENYTPRIRVPQ